VIFPLGLEKRTSAAEAVKDGLFNGTAEAVPFVELSLPRLFGWLGENLITGAKAQILLGPIRPD
jgi:hypothetical protein